MPALKTTVDRLLNELIQINKGIGRDFHAHNENHTKDDHNRFMEVPRGGSNPAARSLAKSVSKMTLDNSDKLSRASKLIKSLKRDQTTEF